MGGEITISEDYQLGPAMQRLNERQRRFVHAMIENGGLNNRRAALDAGFADSPTNPNQLNVTAHRLSHDENIQAAIKEEGIRLLNAGTFLAVKVCLEIAADPTTMKKDKLKAAEMIMNRTGLHATSEHKVAVTHVDRTTDETVKRIEQLAKSMGLDPKLLLGQAAIDAEFVEVVERPHVPDDFIIGGDPNDIGDLL